MLSGLPEILVNVAHAQTVDTRPFSPPTRPGYEAISLSISLCVSYSLPPPPLPSLSHTYSLSLSLSSVGGHDELVELLISHGANIEHRDKKGCTPLILAASAGIYVQYYCMYSK